MLLRNEAKSSLDWLVEAGLSPGYRESGPFTASVSGVQAFALAEAQQILMHYAGLDGRLYGDLAAWRRVVAVVAGFVAEPGPRRPWTPQAPFMVFAPLRPSEALDVAHSALTRTGLALVDRNDRNGSALYRAEETCRVLDLPEPYGKWFQHQERKPRWTDARTLRLDVRCAVAAQRKAPGVGLGADAYVATLKLEFSTLAPSVATTAHRALTDLLGGDRTVSPRALTAAFAPTAQAWFSP